MSIRDNGVIKWKKVSSALCLAAWYLFLRATAGLPNNIVLEMESLSFPCEHRGDS